MGTLQNLSEHRFPNCLQMTSSDLQLPQKVVSYSWLALMAAFNQIVITKVLTNYKTTF